MTSKHALELILRQHLQVSQMPPCYFFQSIYILFSLYRGEYCYVLYMRSIKKLTGGPSKNAANRKIKTMLITISIGFKLIVSRESNELFQ